MTGAPDISPISREVAKYKRKEFNYDAPDNFANYTYQWQHKRNLKLLRVREELLDEAEKENTGYPELSRGSRLRTERSDYKGPFLGYYERLKQMKLKKSYTTPAKEDEREQQMQEHATPSIN